MKALKLTEKEFEILANHFIRDVNYGSEGTFGDGERLFKKELDIAYKIIKKMREIA